MDKNTPKNCSIRLNKMKECLADIDRHTNAFVCTLESFASQLRSIEGSFLSIYDKSSISHFDCNSYVEALKQADVILQHYEVIKNVNRIGTDKLSNDVSEMIGLVNGVNNSLLFLTANRPDSIETTTATLLFDSLIAKLENDLCNFMRDNFTTDSSILHTKTNNTEYQPNTPKTNTPLNRSRVNSSVHFKDHGCHGNEVEFKFSGRPNLEGYYSKFPYNINKLKNTFIWLNDHFPAKFNYFIDLFISVRSELLTVTLKNTNIRTEVLQSTPISTFSSNYRHLSFKNTGKFSPMQTPQTYSYGRSSRNIVDLTDAFSVDYLVSSLYNLSILAETELDLIKSTFAQFVPEAYLINRIFQMIVISRLEPLEAETIRLDSVLLLLGTCELISSALSSLLAALKNIYDINSSFKTAVGHEGDKLEAVNAFSSKMMSLFVDIQMMVGKIMEHQVEVIQKDPLNHSLMPTDGNVHEFAAKAMPFLKIIFENKKSVGECLNIYYLRRNDLSFPKKYLDLTLSAATLKVVDFIVKAFLPALEANLLQKATLYSESGIRNIFLMNSFTYIQRNLSFLVFEPSCDRDKIIVRLLEDTKNRIKKNIVKFENEYFQIWNHLFKSFECDVYKSNSELREKERRAIKEMFNVFNKELEEIVKCHGNMYLADSQQRKDICSKCSALVVRKYQQEVQVYARLPFSSTPSKYLKYDKQSLISLINGVYGI